MRKNQYEEALFRVEDDRFELDMMIETNASAMRTMANLARQLEVHNPVDVQDCRFLDFFPALLVPCSAKKLLKAQQQWPGSPVACVATDGST